jgi:hypothetical protein
MHVITSWNSGRKGAPCVGTGVMQITHILLACTQDIADDLVTSGHTVMIVRLQYARLGLA